jgi:hypothetical protein
MPLSSAVLCPASTTAPQYDKETIMAAAISTSLRNFKCEEEKEV